MRFLAHQTNRKKLQLWAIVGVALAGIGIVLALQSLGFLPPSVVPTCIVLVIGMSIIIGSIVHWFKPVVEERRQSTSLSRNVRYCFHCGANISMDANYCPKCGNGQGRIAERLEETQIY